MKKNLTLTILFWSMILQISAQISQFEVFPTYSSYKENNPTLYNVKGHSTIGRFGKYKLILKTVNNGEVILKLSDKKIWGYRDSGTLYRVSDFKPFFIESEGPIVLYFDRQPMKIGENIIYSSHTYPSGIVSGHDVIMMASSGLDGEMFFLTEKKFRKLLSKNPNWIRAFERYKVKRPYDYHNFIIKLNNGDFD